MTLQEWTEVATAAAHRAGMPDLPALVSTLASATAALRAADWNVRADASDTPPPLAAAPLTVPTSDSVREVTETASAHAALPPPSGRLPSPTEAPHLQPISAIANALRDRRLSSRDLAEACLSEIDRQDPSLNAFITVTSGLAREQADVADREIAAGRYRGPLHGIPISIKDLVDLEGVPTTAASRVRAGVLATRDATVVTRLRAAGAVFVGKCNLHEFALGTTNEDSAFGPAHHPGFPDRSPGGSSGGSAVSIASGMAFASVGTDTGGSIRIPAAACGLVGFKPPFGMVASDGIVPLSASLDHVGPLARTVRDATLMFEAMSGRRASAPARRAGTLRLGVLRRYFMDVLDAGVRGVVERAFDRLRSSGAALVERAIAHAPLTAPVYLHTGLAEAAAYHAATLEARPGDYTPPVRVRLELGRLILGEDYARAQIGRAVLRAEVEAALDEVDALLLPTLPIVAPPLGASSVDIDGVRESVRNATLRLTQLFDLTGHPAISLPAGLVAEGLPVGLQLVGRHAGSADLLAVAEAVETALDRE
jgi:aspartyl-tRNA(Asn)/glutamyl-tRNA(Gln) amidotransferase subunit A